MVSHKDSNCRDISVYRKTSKAFEFIFTKNNCPVDITGYTLYFTAKKKMQDPDGSAVITKDITTHLDASGGRSLINLTDVDTDIDRGSYYYDVKYTDTDDNAHIIMSGRLQIKEPVTTRG